MALKSRPTIGPKSHRRTFIQPIGTMKMVFRSPLRRVSIIRAYIAQSRIQLKEIELTKILFIQTTKEISNGMLTCVRTEPTQCHDQHSTRENRVNLQLVWHLKL